MGDTDEASVQIVQNGAAANFIPNAPDTRIAGDGDITYNNGLSFWYDGPP